MYEIIKFDVYYAFHRLGTFHLFQSFRPLSFYEEQNISALISVLALYPPYTRKDIRRISRRQFLSATMDVFQLCSAICWGKLESSNYPSATMQL